MNLIQAVLSEHERFWGDQRSELGNYKAAYETKFWKSIPSVENQIRVETADGYAQIESLIASLFSKSPAIEVESYDTDNRTKEIVRTVINRFLYDKKTPIEHGSRMALIYPQAFLKLAPRESTDVLDRVSVRACEPWTVIVDRDADDWESQRYVGHIYWIPLPEAKSRFGSKAFKPVKKEDYFDEDITGNKANPFRDPNFEVPADYLFIKVVEFYDLLYDKLYFWSPNYMHGEKLLKESVIGTRTHDDRPLPCIAPLYFCAIPDAPLEGYSTMSRMHDQIFEKNMMRTHMANCVRRDSRQFVYKRGALDDMALAQLASGEDGAMIGVDEDKWEDIVMRPVEVPPMSSNYANYNRLIESDLQRGSVLAPFTRGESTNVTATEITALSTYTATEIGRMARERDGVIEKISEIYIRMLDVLWDEGEKATILVNGKPEIVQQKYFDVKYRFAAKDQASTPLSRELKNQHLVTIAPMLIELGLNPNLIRDKLIEAYDLPDSWRSENDPAPPPAPEEGIAPPTNQPGIGNGGAGAQIGMPPVGDILKATQ